MTAAWFEAFVASTGFGPGQMNAISENVQTPSSHARPRGVDPRGVDPRGVDPRGVDPRGVDPRGVDPRGVDSRGAKKEDNFAIPLLSRSGRQQKATLPEQFAPGVPRQEVPNASQQLGGDVPGLIKTQNLPSEHPGRYRRPPSAALNRQQLLVNKDGLYPSERTAQKNWEAVGVGKAVREKVNLPTNLEPAQVISSALRENETGVTTTISGFVAQIVGPILLFVSTILLVRGFAKNQSVSVRAIALLVGLGLIVAYFFVNTRSTLHESSTWWSTWVAEFLGAVVFYIMLKFAGVSKSPLIFATVFFLAAITHHLYTALIVTAQKKKEAMKESMLVREDMPREAFDREGYMQLDEPAVFPANKDQLDNFAARLQQQGTKPLEGPRAGFGYQRAPMDPTGRTTMPVSNLMRSGKVMNFDDGAVGEYLRQLGGEMPNQFYQAHPYYTFNAHWANRNKIDDGETQFGIASSPGQMNRKWIYRQPKIDQAGAKTSHMKDIAPSAMDPLEKSHPWMSPDELGEAVLAGTDSGSGRSSTPAPERFVAEIEELSSDDGAAVVESKEEETWAKEEDELMRPKTKTPREQPPPLVERELPEALRPIDTMSERKRRMNALIPVAAADHEEERKSDDGDHSALFHADGNDADEDLPSSFAGFFIEKKQPSEQDVQTEINKKQ